MKFPAETSKLIDLGTFTGVKAGDAVETDGFDRWTWQVIFSGTITDAEIALEGSIDGSNWFELDFTTSTSNEMRHVVNKPVRYIRANVKTLTGTTPQVEVKAYGVR